MIRGVGSLILGDEGFATDLIPLCAASFTLSFEYQTTGYNYLNSSNKMMMAAVENFDAGVKSWTISSNLASLNGFSREYLMGTRVENTEDHYGISFYGGQTPLDIPLLSPAEVQLFNQTTNTLMVLVTTPMAANEYAIISNQIVTHSSAAAHLLCLFVAGSEGSFDIAYITNKVFSYSGVVYSTDDSTHGIYCPRVQISQYPGLSIAADQEVTFDVLDEIKIYKI